MRAVVQRVTRGGVVVIPEAPGEPEPIAAIGSGLVVLLGVAGSDTAAEAEYIAEKLVHLRIFDDENGIMNRSALDTGAAILLVSQFTLYGDCRKGRRPSYIEAASPQQGETLYELVGEKITSSYGLRVAKGRFRSHMRVDIQNDGPVTILLDSQRRF